jgi:hypothetical protein
MKMKKSQKNKLSNFKFLLAAFAAVILCSCQNITEEPDTTTTKVANTSEATIISDKVKAAGENINIKTDCGAKGDGKTNDTEAFQKAAKLIKEAKGGKLTIPQGVYIVGGQIHKPGEYPYYQALPILEFKDLDGVEVVGDKAVLKLADGLHYGSFDKDTGEPYTPSTPIFTDGKYAANAYWGMLSFRDCRNVVVRNLELDGNCSKLIIGGSYGDTGRQLGAHGISMHNNNNVRIENLYTHHHACDGIIIGWTGLKDGDQPTPHTLVNVNSEYNGRQALSWVGGRGITAINCKFNHTGRAGISSAPGAGLDIEAESAVCRDGVFKDCEFINNVGCGVVADSGDGGYTTFENCVIWGTTSWAMWNVKPGIKFNNCRFYGSIIYNYGSAKEPELATQYRNCSFEDKEDPKFGVYRGAALISNGGANVLFENCDVVANKVNALSLTNGVILRNCRITHKNADGKDGSAQSSFHKCLLENVHFMEKFPENFSKKHYIGLDRVKIGEGIIVDGPVVKWSNCDGLTGQIPPSAKK